MAVVVYHGGGTDVLGLKAYAVGAAGSQTDFDAEDCGVCDGRRCHCGPCDGLIGDDLVGGEVIATGPSYTAEQYAATVRHHADVVALRATLHRELRHRRGCDDDMLAPDWHERVVARESGRA